MKKLITSIILTLASALAFAITDAQKAEFINLIKSDVKGGAEFASTVEATAKTELAQTVGAWVEENPLEYYSWVQSDNVEWKYKNGLTWVVRKALNKSYEAFTLQDAIINDFNDTFDLACVSSSAYSQLKLGGFALSNVKMTEWKVFYLVITYFDYDTLFASVREVYIAERFDALLKSIPKAKLSAKDNYELYSKITKNFAQYKDSVKAVKDNWEKLQNDKNEAFMQYYAEQKLQNLNK